MPSVRIYSRGISIPTEQCLWLLLMGWVKVQFYSYIPDKLALPSIVFNIPCLVIPDDIKWQHNIRLFKIWTQRKKDVYLTDEK